ncbi:sigma-54-dependent Fis family transcriptional regulator [Liquorilactobacillus satsumensis]|uniref:Transcriptional regulator AcoR n=1 Tax=Liquorilactobacillus satsumensis DSM 16230 = JCM 12392 TaxID=1423801 RepID=A0A0R1V1P2_9LACO|nr:sigma-54-dependent Fis family transcriptional regulator [Liquorilactobacillus satsumensis]KRL99044.1 transcriptional regulator AcoR [Liquorilactobacillus satsumensis DSM 16230 = JCM 12392]
MTEQQLWKHFIAGEKVGLSKLPQKIAQSWELCYKEAVNPFSTRPQKILTIAALQTKQKQKKELIQTVEQQVKSFQDRFALQDYLFILTDATGDILWRSGCDDTRDRANEMYFREGTNWSERNVGTNAIGLALRTKSNEYVELNEHYAATSRQWSCAAAPINSADGQLLGVLDISTFRNDSVKDAQLLLNIVAQQVANVMTQKNLERKQDLFRYLLANPNHTLLVCDLDFKIISLPTKYADFLKQGEDFRKFLQPATIYKTSKICYEGHVVGYQVELFNETTPAQQTFYYPGVPSLDENYQDFLHKTLQVAHSNLPVHIYGESGSGKEIIAKTLHYNSQASAGPLVTVNCGAISENLLESELFGYAPGAFTGAAVKGSPGKILQANKGTLFLDEVDSMPFKMQTALLRVLEEQSVTPLNGKPQKVSFQLITASNRDLRKLVATGHFRADLFYRIYVCQLQIPPLRARKSDMKQLLKACCEEKNWQIDWGEKIYTVAVQYPWYGNIREFRNFLERVYLFYPTNEPTSEQLHELVQAGSVIKRQPAQNSASELAVEQIRIRLQHNHYQISKTAADLGISRTTLYRKIKKYGL